jgi:acyl carrier protein
MTRKEIESRLREYDDIETRGADSQLALLQAAIFLEEAFGVTIEDAEIRADTLGTKEARLLYISKKAGL